MRTTQKSQPAQNLTCFQPCLRLASVCSFPQRPLCLISARLRCRAFANSNRLGCRLALGGNRLGRFAAFDHDCFCGLDSLLNISCAGGRAGLINGVIDCFVDRLVHTCCSGYGRLDTRRARVVSYIFGVWDAREGRLRCHGGDVKGLQRCADGECGADGKCNADGE